MSPAARKFLVTLATAALATGVFLVVLNSKRGQAHPEVNPANATTPANGETPPASAGQTPAPPAASGAPEAKPADANAGATKATPTVPPTGLVARAPTGGFAAGTTPTPIGSLDPKVHPFRITFTNNAAGIQSIVFSQFWKTVADSRQARLHAAGGTNAPPLPGDDARYVLAHSQTVLQGTADGTRSFEVPVCAVHSVVIDGAAVPLFANVWSETAPGSFATEIVDADGTVRFRIERRFVTTEGSYDLLLEQSIKNLGSDPASVQWIQYGPGDLVGDPALYIDVRRFHFGYLLPPARDPGQATVLATGQMYEHAAVAKQIQAQQFTLWPNEASRKGSFGLSWFGTTSRYFAFAVHPPMRAADSSKLIGSALEEVRTLANGEVAPNDGILTELHSGKVTVAGGGEARFDMGLYAGPLDPDILGGIEPYQSLGMQQLIVYLLSGCCSFCTFAWLANLLVAFLSFLHDYLVFDWGLAIIVLVIVVRLILHPLMKRSQIQMQRFSRGMAELKPELDALQKRYKEDPQKLQAEQLRLYREKNVNPVGCVGGLAPTFLQMPIWMALYAVLFFSWDLRQSPAFFGLFQLFGGWGFLADLSRPDNFVTLPATKVLFFVLDGINLLPILMGVVFFLQQKYAAPPTPNMSPEQESQQKMMKWMMVLMFPLMMYKAPSGLTLYIMTSTLIGIWESRMVKAHIEKFGLADPKKAKAAAATAPKKKQDLMGRMYEEALERARQRQADKNKKTFKERD